MSKGNLFLGYGRGKIGDIVLTRGEGQQISRARNRSPRNPKTEKQMYQRAVMATVMAMYKAGKTIFDHSFQGKQVALGSMKRFMSVNAKKLRENIVADLTNNEKTCTVISPGAVSPVPNNYRISEGSMPQGIYKAEAQGGALVVALQAPYDASVRDYLVSGDIYTIIGLDVIGETTVGDKISPATILGYVRLTVKDNLPDQPFEEARWNDIFDIEENNTKINRETTADADFDLQALFGYGVHKGAIGVIRSREDSGLRSTSDMVTNEIPGYGVTADNIATVWNANVEGLGNSELILEGGDI